MINIPEETRLHLIRFLEKTLAGTYTQNELENFVISGYQNEIFERVRTTAIEIITGNRKGAHPPSKILSEDDAKSITEIICELEKLGNKPHSKSI